MLERRKKTDLFVDMICFISKKKKGKECDMTFSFFFFLKYSNRKNDSYWVNKIGEKKTLW